MLLHDSISCSGFIPSNRSMTQPDIAPPMSYLLTWIGEELMGQMKKYKEAVEKTAVDSYPSCLSV